MKLHPPIYQPFRAIAILTMALLILSSATQSHARETHLTSQVQEQNRLFPYWDEDYKSLSEAFYGVPVKLKKPGPEVERRLAGIIRVYVYDLFEQKRGSQVRIFDPVGKMHPRIQKDAEAFFNEYWIDHKTRTRTIKDIEVIRVGMTHRWLEIWTRFVEQDRVPEMQNLNYVAMLVELAEEQEPYLADIKVMGRIRNTNDEIALLHRRLGISPLGFLGEIFNKDIDDFLDLNHGGIDEPWLGID